MKYKLMAYEKKMETIKTARKKFEVPYLETVIEGPIISTDDWVKTMDFFVKFNTMTRDLQIGLEHIEE